MQNILYVEYALGRPWKKYPSFHLVYENVVRVIDYMTVEVRLHGHYIKFDMDRIKDAGLDMDLVKEYVKDPGAQNYLVALKFYREENYKNYIFSNYLTTLLKGTSGDIDCKYLHKEAAGYIEMPGLCDRDGDRVLGALFRIEKDPVWSLQIVWLLEHKDACMISSFFFEDIEKGTIKEVVSRTTNTITNIVDGEIKAVVSEGETSWDTMELTTINAILWILHNIYEEALLCL